ncbi:MAG TPA: recombinase family protein [candidate division Zixibacteria bacterium]|nr:recombinase family protein [candidate division Zixibacteria bacterium]
MKVGYARILENDQDLSSQLDALKHVGCKQIFTDRVNSLQKEQPGLETTLNYMREDDILVVWQLKHLGRSLKQLVDIVNHLGERGYGFQSLHDNIDTTTSDGVLIFRTFATLAKFGRDINKELTQAGLQAARARGRKGGRPKKLDAAKTDLLYRLYDEKQLTVTEICGVIGISRPTLYAYLRRKQEK